MKANTHLIVMAGLPCSGKSTVARGISQNLGYAILSIDPIEASMWRSSISKEETGIAAYNIAHAIAKENLIDGTSVIIDAVNPVKESRDMWLNLQKETNATLTFIECVCSARDVHKERVEKRIRNIKGMNEITWERVEQRRAEYEAWNIEHHTIETSDKEPSAIVKIALEIISDK